MGMPIHTETRERVRQLLSTGCDVRLTGTAGSGKSTALHLLYQADVSLRRPALLVRGLAAASDAPLAAFLADGAWALSVPGPAGFPQVTRRLDEVIAEEPGTLFVDDIHRLDRLSLAAIEYAQAAHAGMRVVSTTPLGHPEGLAAAVHRSAATIQIAPLGVRDTTRLVEERTGRAASPAFVAKLTALSGGNPRIALGMLALSIATHSERHADDTDQPTRLDDLDDVDGAPLLESWCSELGPHERAALTTLAWAGPTPLVRAASLVDEQLLPVLVSAGYAAVTSGGHSELVVVTPPAIARALVRRHEHSGLRRLQAISSPTGDGERSQAVADASIPSPPAWWEQPLARSAEQDAVVLAVTSLIERFRVHTSLLWDAWRMNPTVGPALDLLRPLMTTDAGIETLAEVFDGTESHADDSPAARAEFAILRAQWEAWRRDTAPDADRRDDEGTPGPGANLDHRSGISDIVAQLRAGRSVVSLARAISAKDAVGEAETNGIAFLQGAAAVESGWPQRMLDMWDEHSIDPDAPFGENLLSLHGEALLLAGRGRHAERLFADRLAIAQDRLDPFATRLACRGLATVLVFDGRLDEAWRALGVAMRLGRSGILTVGYDERVLGLAAIVRARLGDLKTADGLLRDLENLPPTGTRLLDIMLPWARAEIAVARDPLSVEAATACERMWEAGERLRDSGHLTAGLLCGALLPGPLDSPRLRLMTELSRSVEVRALDPIWRLHEHIGSGTAEELLAAVRRFRAGGPLARAALRVASERGADVSATRLRETLGDRAFVHLERAGGVERSPSETLSSRETEVLTLAQQGLTNAQIAEQLYVSTRTVESHMLKGLRKLGLSSRRQLGQWDPALWK
jgi:DNA-binding CsgD family transcriptional regulator